jgi:O-antigen/teichoic acid export membrane protein
MDHLGKKNYGTWALAGSFLGYYGLMRLGIGSGLIRYVPFHVGRGDHKSASEIVSTGIGIFLIVGLVIVVVSFLAAEAIARFYDGGPALAALVRILGLAAAIECPMRILGGTVRAHERWVEANLVTIATVLARALSLAGCVYLGYGLVQMGYAILGVTIFSLILTTIMFIKFCPLIRLRFSLLKVSQLRCLISFGFLTVIVTLAYSLCLDGHKLIIGKLISLEAVAIYAVVAVLMINARAVVVTPNRIFWPRFALLDGEGNHREMSRLLFQGTQYNTILASGIILLAIIAGPSFIGLWMGEGFESVSPILFILAVGYLIETSLAINASLLGGVGRQRAQAIFAVIEGVLGFALSILLGQRIGLVGVALGFTISITIVRGLLRTWYICRFLDVSILRYYVRCVLRPWLILGFLVALVYYSRFATYIHNWSSLVTFVVVAGCLYAFCAYAIAMNHDEKKNMLSHIRNLSMRMSIRSGVKG